MKRSAEFERWMALGADESGATLIEYALIIALLALAILTGVSSAGGIVRAGFSAIGTALSGA